MSRPRFIPGSALVALAIVTMACTAASPTPAAPSGINVTLQEWAVVPAATTASAGEVTFQITNNGPNDTHEFVVLKTDIAPGELPTDDRGVVDESGGAMEVMGEVEDVAVGSSETLTLTLPAGNYVLLCNIYDESEAEAHYSQGMRTAFTVE